MNKSYKSVWNETTGTFVATSELAASRGKASKNKKALVLAMLAGGVSLGAVEAAHATSYWAVDNDGNNGASVASGTRGIADGYGATVTGSNGTAVGRSVTASGGYSTAVGNYVTSSGSYSLGVGASVTSSGNNSTTLGSTLTNAANNGVLLGAGGSLDTASTGSVFMATNGGAVTTSSNAFVFNPYGGTSVSGSNDAVVISGTATSAAGAVAIGKGANVTSAGNIAVGTGSGATGTLSAALGSGATASVANSVALGANSVADRANAVSVGSSTAQRQIINMAAGVQSTDAVNVNQLTQAGAKVDSSGNVTGAFVAYDSTAMNSVTLGGAAGTTIKNLKAGAISSASMDAVNGSQLYNVGSTAAAALGGNAAIGADGTISAPTYTIGGKTYNDVGSALAAAASGASAPDAVLYDTTAHTSVTLGNAGTPVKVSNVAAGVAATDAVNVKQLTQAGMTVDTSGNVTNAFVAYDSTSKNKVTLGGTAGTTLANVADGIASKDAVNVEQLTAAGLNIDSSGHVTNSFVAYDDSTKGKVTLGGTAGTTLANVKAGAADMDAVNVAQLKAAGMTVDTSGNVTNAFVAYDSTSKNKVTLGGTAGTTLANVADGVANKDAVNVEQLTAAGLNIDSSGHVTNSFVAYDDSTKGKVTLAGTAGTTLANVKAGSSAMDAVNVAQLQAAGMTVDTSGNVTNAFVAYDSTSKNKVTLGGTAGTTLANVADGVANKDAVNVEQLTAAGLNIDSSGHVTNSFVAYDDSTKGTVTLGGTAGTTLANVKAGSSAMDAVNVAQLQAAGMTVDTSGNVTNAFVAYDSTSKNKVTLGGTAGTTLANVADGVANKDAVNVEQLTAAGLVINSSGHVTNSFVAYDDSTKGKVTLGGGAAGTTLANVKAGIATMDAVNIGQLEGVTTALGGGSTVDAAGNVVAPTYTVNGKTYNDVADAITAAASTGSDAGANNVVYDSATKSKVTLAGTAGTTLSNVKAGSSAMDAVNVAQLQAAGMTVDTSGNVTNAFVAYDSTSKNKVTLGGTAGTTLANVADGVANKDAVNVEQLTQAGLVINSSGHVTNSFVAYDDSTKGTVTLGGTAGTTLANVKAGSSAMDAVNLAQLQAAGMTVDTSGNVTNSFVAYDSTSKNKVTLGGGTAGTTLANVADGVANKDAVNVEQLTQAGLVINSSGHVTNSFVAYDDSTKGKVTLAGTAGTTLANVKAGAADMDAVNLAQLKAAGLNVDTSGNVTNAFVAYDNSAKSSITLGSGTQGAQIHNLVAGSSANDAVNVQQLTDAGLKIDTSGNVTNSFVAYDDSTKNKVTLGGGTAGTTLANVADGVANKDAVNVEQLTQAGLIIDSSGHVTNSFVAYDDSTKGKVTLGGTAGTTLANVKAGIATMDAVNIGQLEGVTTALGGGSTVDAAGNVVAPTYTINGKTYNDVADAINAVSGGGTYGNAVSYDDSTKGKVTLAGTAGTTLANVKAGSSAMDAVNLAQLQAAGMTVDTSGNVTNSFVAYDSTSKNKVTLGGGTAGTTLANVADGVASKDAVNVEQLTAAGLNIDSSGHVTNSFVAYDDSTKGTVTLGGTAGTTLANVKAGAADMDAVNLAQLKAAGLNVDTSGNVTNAFVAYDNSAKSSITLGSGTQGAQIHNLVAGSSANDAVNVQQLTDAGLKIDTSGNVTNSFVAYDDSTKGTVTLGGTAGTTLANVKAGAADMDAVNVAQLKAAGLAVDTSGNVTNSFVAYDDSTKGSVTLGGTAGTTLANVKAGIANMDAVNVSQLSPVVASLGGGATMNANGSITGPTYHMQGGSQTTVGGALDTLDASVTNINNTLNNLGADLVTQDSSSRDILVGSTTDGTRVNMAGTTGNRVVTGVANGAINPASVDAVNGSQLYATASSTAAAIGGGSTVNTDGTISAPSFTVGGTTVNNVGDAITNLDGRTTTNTTDINNIQNTITNMAGSVANAVQYDTAAHDTVTMGGTDGAKVKMTNLQDAVLSATSTDAVTGEQLWNTNQTVAALDQTVQNISTSGSTYVSINTTNGPAAATGDSSVAIGGGAQATAPNSVALGDSSIADQANTVSVGSQGAERRITNVAAGVNGTDAVNMNQLQSTTNSVARTAYSGVAAATALSMIPDVDESKTLSLGIGGGSYQGYASSSIGGTARITQNIKVRAGAAWTTAGTAMGAGASYQW